jgi:PAS domain S-box-containing protein/putative nucleotidyltransferase with HDIG domain
MNEIRTKLLKDLDNVRQKISEMEEAEADLSRESQQLKNEKEHLRSLLEEAPVGIMSIDVQGKIRFINKEMTKIFDTSAEDEIRNQSLWELEAFSGSALNSEIRKVLENQKPAALNIALSTKTGDKRNIHSRMSPIFSRDGSINGVMVIADVWPQERETDPDIKKKLGFEKYLSRCLSRMIGEFDLDKAVQETLIDMGKKSEADRAALFLLYDKNTKMDNTHEWIPEGEESYMDQLQNLALASFPWLSRNLNAAEPVVIQDISELPPAAEKEKEFWTSRNIGSVMLIQIPLDDHPAGCIMLEKKTAPGEWSKEDMDLFHPMAESIGKALKVKREEEKDKERNRRFSRFARAGFEALIVVQDNQIIDANQAAGGLFGYKPSEYIGKDIFFFIDPAQKQDTLQYLESGQSKPMEAKAIKKSGEVVPVEILARQLNENGENLRVIALRDTSGRQMEAGDLRDQYNSLHKMSHDLLKALARTVELRDRYSAGHMKRVTALALSIAKEMQLPKDKLEGLEAAAAIHDIGKIGVPIEILNKPARLTDAEKLVVQSHPEVAYELLKDISFPWPVAKIILQHHERLDGSGYPQGLKGDDILVEARIMGVADVVEAILSNRSHRPASEKDSPLQELTVKKGRLYDSNVVDACLKILADKNFSFDSLATPDDATVTP